MSLGFHPKGRTCKLGERPGYPMRTTANSHPDPEVRLARALKAHPPEGEKT